MTGLGNSKSEIRIPISEVRNQNSQGAFSVSDSNLDVSVLPADVSRLERTLRVYDHSLLRQVASKLIKPRNQWPVEELIERCLGFFENVASIDRRLKELRSEERRLLALIGHSGQPRWRVVHLIELAAALGDSDGMKSIRNLLEAGLLFPEVPETWKRLRSFNQWMTQAGSSGLAVFTHPSVIERSIGESLDWPALSSISEVIGAVHDADGLEWPLRWSVLWQLTSAEPLRRTQQGEFFKRDQDRLRNDSMLNAPLSESFSVTTDLAFFIAELAVRLGILREAEGEWRATSSPALWDKNLLATLVSIWKALPLMEVFQTGDNPPIASYFPSVMLLFTVLLSQIPDGEWVSSRDVQDWIEQHHPGFKQTSPTERLTADQSAGIQRQSPLFSLVLTLTYHLRMIQAVKDKNETWVVRLTPIGRWLLDLGPEPAHPIPPSQTLLVQPNLEIVVYRQGLTPRLIASLTRFAAWKSLGAACLMQIQPETVYRGLESGYDFNQIQQTLNQHNTRPTPAAVLDMLRTWTAKRDRLGIFPNATLFEFQSAEELNEALARGLTGTRLSDRLAVISNESAVDYRQFRLTGTRDYGLPPEKCVDVEADGVTLTIEPERSDLLVESEMRRFARYLESPAENGRRQYRVTSESLGDHQTGGMGIFALEEWFQQRTGQTLPPAIRLLMIAPFQPAAELKQQLVLQVSSTQLADGLMQLPETRAFIQARLGPMALAVAPDCAEELRRRIEQLGLRIQPTSISNPT
jgi:hypothetical protein